MKRDPNLIPLSHDHRRVLFIAQNLKKNGPKFKGYPTEPEEKRRFAKDFWDNDLTQHVLLEEEVVFPFIEAKSEELAQIIKELRAEHEELRNYFHSFSTQRDDLVGFMDKLGHLLEKHIRKEERVFFQRTQDILEEEELNQLGKNIRTFKRIS